MRAPFAFLIAGLGYATLAFAVSDTPPAPLVAGEAVVVVGGVTASDGRGRHALQNGAMIAEGSTLETGASGHLYIVTVDKGFISVRPNSSVTIERYRYDAARPEKTEIKILLNRGVVRAISGTGAQAARENYRMNTPVVALGIRGTDFSVFADASTTRAEVRRGGIVLTPYGADCSPADSGPCGGPRATQLFTGDRNVLLQFRRGDSKPVALDESYSYLRPDRIAPPRKDEGAPVETSAKPAGTTSAGTASNGNGTPATSVAPNEVSFTPPELPRQPPAEPPAAPPATAPAPAPAPEPTPVPVSKPEPQQVFWGRWSAVASLPATTSIEELQKQASQLVALNPWFAIAKTPTANFAMPVAGRFDFKLGAYEAYVINSATNTASAAQILNPSLSVDFGKLAFATGFDVAAGGASYNVASKGSVLPNGELQGDLFARESNARVRGTLGGTNATQAGFIFSRTIEGTGLTAVGATSWSR